MRKEYDLKKLRPRPGQIKVDPGASKVPISIRIDGSTLAHLKEEAATLGMPYQTLLGSILYRYAHHEFIERRTLHLIKTLNKR